MTYHRADQTPPSTKVASFFGGVVVLTASMIGGCSKATPVPELLAGAQRALIESDLDKVEELVRQIPPESSEWQAAQLLAGEAATRANRFDAAIGYYTAAAQRDGTTSDGQLAQFSAAEVYLEIGQLTDAERLYRTVLKSQPGNGLTNERMAFLLSMTGRRWAALDHYFVLIKGGEAGYRELALAADVGRPIEQPDFLRKCQQQNPNGELVRLALATHAYDEGESEAAVLLTNLVESSPHLISAQSMLGELLVDAPSETTFIRWNQSLPPEAAESPDIWFVRSLWARKLLNLKAARECLRQTVSYTPFHRRAFYMLGQVLLALDDPQAGPVAAYAELLVSLSQSIDQVLISKGNNEAAMKETAELLEQLGRTWEACAWAVVGRDTFKRAKWPTDILNRQSHKLEPTLPWIEPAMNPASNWESLAPTHFENLVAKVSGISAADATSVKDQVASSGIIHFDESPVISFQYFNGQDLSTKGVRTFEQTGGGVAIIDFDVDGLPDVFLPQGSDWKTGDQHPTSSDGYSDKLFRNVIGRGFVDASHGLAAADSGFGQGCSTGDYNNDGFPDLYVANIGRNCLYENLGDGTFLDITESAGISDQSWTVSTMIGDLNADDLPDIFDVNYLMGDGVFEKICEGRACSPSVFPGAPDRLLINQGDGSFHDVADATPAENSKGLGVVAFELDATRRPKLFVANDQVANYFLDNRPADNPHRIELSNHANTTGLAFNDNGLPMACMGVAIDDFDGDNSLDLFVTNFLDEPNTLYLQNSLGFFGDATKAAGLQAASIPFTGWGTQSLDADLDGWSDLVVANGHVDDYRDEGGEYQMRPQFFHNRNGRFKEAMPESVGPWFADKILGRGLARVDWNMDGLPEFIVSNINSPLAVLKNTSTEVGSFLKLKLVATRTARDAIGARVSVQRGDREVSRQLLAGDGYMASNERIVHFGLGLVEQIDRVTIYWPSGSTSLIEPLRSNSSLVVVEGSAIATISDLSGLASSLVVSVVEGKR
jgi:tetratricopeptide (TPR) repeat protein